MYDAHTLVLTVASILRRDILTCLQNVFLNAVIVKAELGPSRCENDPRSVTVLIPLLRYHFGDDIDNVT